MKSKKINRQIARLLVFVLILAILPVQILADWWSVEEADNSTGYIYAHTGNEVLITGELEDGAVEVANLVTLQGANSVRIRQYEIADIDPVKEMFLNTERYDTYCADYEVYTQAYTGDSKQTYRRDSIEKSWIAGLETTAKGTAPERLRAILTHSDLWITLEDMQSQLNTYYNTNKYGSLTEKEFQAAVQMAIWGVTNPDIGLKRTEGAYSNNDVADCYKYLLNLQGVKAEELSKIIVVSTDKKLDANSDPKTYTATVVCELVGSSVTEETELPELNINATYSSGGQEVTKNAAYVSDDADKTYTITVTGIPIGCDLSLDINAAVQADSVFVFTPENKGDTQTLVTVVEDADVNLKTSATVNGPADFAQLTVKKVWKFNTSDGVKVADAVVRDKVSVFRITYWGNDNPDDPDQVKIDGLKVLEDIEIAGNGYQPTGYLFQAGTYYRIVELDEYGNEPQSGDKVAYFTVKIDSSDRYNVVWVDENKNVLTDQSSGGTKTFTNVLTAKTGTVTVEKKLHKSIDDSPLSTADYGGSFTFTAKFQSANGGTPYPYSGADYTVYSGGTYVESGVTDEYGQFTLRAGQKAVLEGVPEGTLTITEAEDNTNGFEYDPEITKAAQIDTQGVTRDLTFTNKLIKAKLKITKEFGADSKLGWDKISSIQFSVVHSGNTAAETVTLTAGETSKEIEIVPGYDVTITETVYYSGGVTVGNYDHGVEYSWKPLGGNTSAVSSGAGTIPADSVTAYGLDVTVTNTYSWRLGSIEITKNYNVNADVAGVMPESKPFSFTLLVKNESGSWVSATDFDGNDVSRIEMTIDSNDSDTFTVSGLLPGIYKVVEDNAYVPNVVWTYQVGNGTAVPVDDASTNAAAVKPESGEIGIDGSDEEITFSNTYSKENRTLIIKKEFSGLSSDKISNIGNITFEVTGPGGYSETVTLNAGNNWTHTCPGLASGNYTVTENKSEAAVSNYDLTVNAKVGATAAYAKQDVIAATLGANGDSKSVYFKNEYVTKTTASVEITKLAAGGDAGDTFDFCLYVGGKAAGGYSYALYDAATGDKLSNDSDNLKIPANGKFTLSHNERIVITGLPTVTNIYVEEDVPTGKYELTGIDQVTNGTVGTVSANIANRVTVKSADTSVTAGLADGEKMEATYNNTRVVANLKVSKTVRINSGSAAERDTKEFNFVLAYDKDGSKPVGGVTYDVYNSSGTAAKSDLTLDADGKFTLTNGQYAEFKNLPTGDYYVIELMAGIGIERYAHSVYMNSSTVQASKNNAGDAYYKIAVSKSLSSIDTVAVENHYTLGVGTATIIKKVEKNGATNYYDSATEFTLQVMFDPAIDKDVNLTLTVGGSLVSEPEWILDDDDNYEGLTFELIDNQTAVIGGIPNSTKCTVTETGIDTSRYDEPAWANGIYEQTVTDNNNLSFTCVNTLKVGHVTVEKKMFLGDIGSAVPFPNPMSSNVSFSGRVTSGDKYDSWQASIASGGSSAEHADEIAVPLGMTITISELSSATITNYTKAGTTFSNGTDTDSNPSEVTITVEDAEAVYKFTVNNYYTRDTGTLQVKKTVSQNDEGNNGTKPYTDSEEYSFYLYSDSVYTIPIAGAVYKIGVAEDQTDSDGKFTLKHNQTAVFSGLATGTYYVKEDIDEAAGYAPSGTYTYTVDVGGTYVSSAANSGKAAATIAKGATTTATFKNTYTFKTAKLNVTKTVTGAAIADSFTFTLYKVDNDEAGTVSNASYDVYENGTKINSGTTGAGEYSGVFTLKHGQTAKFANLPEGTYYVVEELSTHPDTYDFVTKYSKDGGQSSEQDGEDAAVTINQNDQNPGQITVTNAYTRHTGSLTVIKEVATDGDEDTERINADTGYQFKLESTTAFSGSYTIYGSSGAGAATAFHNQTSVSFTLNKDQHIVFTNLETGGYTVTEINGYFDGHVHTVAVADGDENPVSSTAKAEVKIEKDGDETLVYANGYERNRVNLTVTKTVSTDLDEGDDGAELSGIDFTFVITGPNGPLVDQPYKVDGESTDNNGQPYTTGANGGFTLRADQTARFEGLLSGNYTVTETYRHIDNKYGMIPAVNGEEGWLFEASIDTGEDAAEFNNHFTTSKGQLTIRKVVDATDGYIDDVLAKTATFKFLITKDGQPYGEIIEVNGDSTKNLDLPIGDYAITEIVDQIAGYGNYTYTHNVIRVNGVETNEFKVDEHDKQISVVCENYYSKDGGSIIVEKTVEGYAGNDTFTFQITPVNGSIPYTVIDAAGNTIDRMTEADGAFKLKNGEKALFRSLEPGETYTVAETLSANYELSAALVESYTVNSPLPDIKDKGGDNSFLINNDGSLAVNTKPVDSTISTTQTQQLPSKNSGGYPGLYFSFTNLRKTNTLILSKTVQGPVFDSGTPFEFEIRFSSGSGSVKIDDIIGLGYDGSCTADDDVLRVWLFDGGSAEITGIPVGLQYSVTETPDELYKCSISNDSETVTAGEAPIVVNAVNVRQTGSLTVTKNVINLDNNSRDDSFTIEATFTSEKGESWDESIFDSYFTVVSGSVDEKEVNGGVVTVTMTLKNSGHVKIDNIPSGVKYYVSEPGSGDYYPRIARQTGYIGAGHDKKISMSDIDITVRNYLIPKDGLVISKTVSGAYEGASSYSHYFDFVLELNLPEYGENDATDRMQLDDQIDRADEMYKQTEVRIAELNKLIDALALAVDETQYKSDLAVLRQYVDEKGEPTQLAKDEALQAALEKVEGLVDREYCENCDHNGYICNVCNGEEAEPEEEAGGVIEEEKNDGETEDEEENDGETEDEEEDDGETEDEEEDDGETEEEEEPTTGTENEEGPTTGTEVTAGTTDASTDTSSDNSSSSSDSGSSDSNDSAGYGLVVDTAIIRYVANSLTDGTCDKCLSNDITECEYCVEDLNGLIDEYCEQELEAIINNALAMFKDEAGEDAAKKAEYEEELERLNDKLARIIEIYKLLNYYEQYVDFDDDANILNSYPVKAVDLDIKSQVTAYEDGEEIGIDGEVNFMQAVDEDENPIEGKYLFSLKDNQCLVITGIPVDTAYTVTELESSYKNTGDVWHETNVQEDELEPVLTDTISGKIVDTDGNGKLITFFNDYETPTGTLRVEKEWKDNNWKDVTEVAIKLEICDSYNEVIRTEERTIKLNDAGEWIGCEFDGLPIGLGYTYRISEVRNPDISFNVQYKGDNNDNKFEFEDFTNTTQTATVVNSLSSGEEPGDFNIKINKTDPDGRPLSGAEFEITNSGGALVGTVTTNSDGTATIGGLPEGKYYVLETRAPSGYRLNSTPTEVNISSDNSSLVEFTATINVINYPTGGWTTDPDDPTTPTTTPTTTTTPEDTTETVDGDDNTPLTTLQEETADDGNTPLTQVSEPDSAETVEELEQDIPTGGVQDIEVIYEARLPQAGSGIDTWTLITFGLILVAGGAAALLLPRFRKKEDEDF